MYYLRTKPAAAAIQFTVDRSAFEDKAPGDAGIDDDDDDAGVCLSCQ